LLSWQSSVAQPSATGAAKSVLQAPAPPSALCRFHRSPRPILCPQPCPALPCPALQGLARKSKPDTTMLEADSSGSQANDRSSAGPCPHLSQGGMTCACAMGSEHPADMPVRDPIRESPRFRGCSVTLSWCLPMTLVTLCQAGCCHETSLAVPSAIQQPPRPGKVDSGSIPGPGV
jgi:hypothetical protein